MGVISVLISISLLCYCALKESFSENRLSFGQTNGNKVRSKYLLALLTKEPGHVQVWDEFFSQIPKFKPIIKQQSVSIEHVDNHPSMLDYGFYLNKEIWNSIPVANEVFQLLKTKENKQTKNPSGSYCLLWQLLHLPPLPQIFLKTCLKTLLGSSTSSGSPQKELTWGPSVTAWLSGQILFLNQNFPSHLTLPIPSTSPLAHVANWTIGFSSSFPPLQCDTNFLQSEPVAPIKKLRPANHLRLHSCILLHAKWPIPHMSVQ